MTDVVADDGPGPSAEIGELEHVQLSRGIRVRQFQTRLHEATCLDAGEAQGKAKKLLRKGGFDYAPVHFEGKLQGYVAEEDLEADADDPVRSRLRPITDGIIVSGDAPFSELLRWLDAGFLFVLEGNRLTGFVTHADTNKHAARSYFYLLVSQVEVGLARLISSHFEAVDEALHLLAEDRRERIEARLRSDREKNLDADVVSYFEFCDLATVAGKTKAIRLGYSYNRWKSVTGSLTRFRNWVMHPCSRTRETYTIAKLIDLEGRLIELSAGIRKARQV
jgi:hypothetical protein